MVANMYLMAVLLIMLLEDIMFTNDMECVCRGGFGVNNNNKHR